MNDELIPSKGCVCDDLSWACPFALLIQNYKLASSVNLYTKPWPCEILSVNVSFPGPGHAVAGGAGHVRRLVTEDGLRFRQVVEKAIAITKGCNCSPSCYSCLRNYYNQKIHDLLNRKYAYDFLENYSGDLEPITNEEFEGAEEPGKV